MSEKLHITNCNNHDFGAGSICQNCEVDIWEYAESLQALLVEACEVIEEIEGYTQGDESLKKDFLNKPEIRNLLEKE